MEDRHVTAAAVPLKVGKLDLLVAPLTDEQIEELNEYVRDQYCQGCFARVPKGLSPQERELHLGAIYDRSASLSWMYGQGAKMMASRVGISRIVWTMARAHHPGLTHQQVHDAIATQRDTDEANRVFRRANEAHLGEGEAARPGRSRPRTGRSQPRASRRK